jgi:dTDP-4-dehydrorhamnose 3,5-epimerase
LIPCEPAFNARLAWPAGVGYSWGSGQNGLRSKEHRMNVIRSTIPDVLIVEPSVFRDPRGFFKETWQRNRYAEMGIEGDFIQDNISRSRRGTLRGLHFQIKHAQGKLVQALSGRIFDVAVDLRKNSPTFGHWVGRELSDENHYQMYIPPGFAHGFCVLSETADLFYKCTDFYYPEHERTLLWNDPAIGIRWPLDTDPVLSDKDRRGTRLAEIECYKDL